MATYKRVNADQLNADLKAVADSIRAKTGSTESLSFPSGFVSGIESITGGGGGSVEGVHFVTFMNGGEVLFVRPVADGDTCADVVERGIIPAPTKESTDQYDYSYYGWGATDGGAADSSILNNITADKTVYAIYASVVRTYTITYYDEDGTTVLHTETLAYGAKPSYVPTKEGKAFSGWTPAITTVSGNASYTATWSEAVASGSLNDNTSWTLMADGTLYINGTGATPTFSESNKPPFYDYRQQITQVVVGEGISSLGKYMFYNSSYAITQVVLPTTLKSIFDYCLGRVTSLTDINLEDTTITSVGRGAFSGCTGLTSVTLPDTVIILYNEAFSGCTGLTSVTLSNSLKTISHSAFMNCSNLKTISIPASVTSVVAYAFAGAGLEEIFVDSNNATYTSVNNIIYNKNLTELVYCAIACGITQFTVPSTVTKIHAHAFLSNKTLTELTVPASVVSIDCNAFAYCSNLASVTVEETTGWYYASSATSTNKTSISSGYMGNPTTVAKYLRETYCSKFFGRTVS